MKLTENQNRIVKIEEQTNNPYTAVLASAGSGKSTVVENRVAHLVLNQKVEPERIALFSFSRAATKEIRDRLKEKLGTRIFSRLDISTLHSFAYQVVRKHYNKSKETTINIMGSNQFAKLVKSFVDHATGSEAQCDANVIIEEVMTSLKNNRKPKFSSAYQSLYRDVRDWMDGNNLWLFDDLLFETYRILSNNAELLKRYQNQYDYWFIDEAQDTTRIMIDIVELLLRKDTHLMMSFDIVQSLYQFAGADPFYLMYFIDRIGADLFRLDETFRFGPQIAELADMVVTNIDLDERFKMFTKTNQVSNTPIYVPGNSDQMVTDIADDIFEKANNGVPLRDMTVLSRTNRPLVDYQKALARKGIPSKMKFGYIWNRKEVSLLLTLLRVLSGHSSADLETLTNRLPSKFNIDKKRLRLMYASYENEDVIQFLHYFLENKVKGLGMSANSGIRLLLSYLEKAKAIVESENRASMQDLFKQLALSVDIDECDFMREEATGEGMDNNTERWQFINLLDTIRNEKEENPFELENLLRIEFTTEEEEETDAVELKTIHSAKGMTLPYVYLIADTFSTKFIQNGDDFRSELFVLYVAITRTKTELQIWGSLLAGFRFLHEANMDIMVDDEEQLEEPDSPPKPLLEQILEDRPNLRNNPKVREPVSLKWVKGAVAETAKAVRLEFENPHGETSQHWIPKSQMMVKEGKIAVSRWLATKNQIA